jgi:hypothetical protein
VSTETTEYTVAVITNITRDGRAKAVRNLAWSDTTIVPIDRVPGFIRLYVAPQADYDIPAVTATVRAHTYPGSDTPRAYASLDDVRAALAPHRTGGSK